MRRARARAQPDLGGCRRRLRRGAPRCVARPHDQAAPGRHPPAVRLARGRSSGPVESDRRGAGTDARREEGQDAGPAARGSAAAPRLDRHVGHRWPRRPGAAWGDDLQLRPDVGLRRHAYLRDGGTLECAQAIAGHECACTTQLYDSAADDITAEDIERIRFLRIAGILTNLAWGGVPAGNGVGVSGRQVLSTASRTASRFRLCQPISDPMRPVRIAGLVNKCGVF